MKFNFEIRNVNIKNSFPKSKDYRCPIFLILKLEQQKNMVLI